jgi:hypothetical protein
MRCDQVSAILTATGTTTVKSRVRAFLAANPDIADQSINQVGEALTAAGIKAGRTTVAEVLKEVKQPA